MKTFILKLFCFMLIVSTALFIGTACKNEEDAVSQGLEFESSSDNTGYAVAGIGDCFDTKIIIPSTYNDKPVVEIKEEAFKDYYLTSITIPESVTSIGNDAFYRSYKLVEVINKSPYITVTKGSDNNGYLGCYALSVSNCDDGYVSKVSVDSNGFVIYTKGNDKILVNYIGTNINITIPSDITEINENAFYDYTNLTSVIIGNSVTSIGNLAFYDCDNLTSVTIGDGVTSIGYYAFYICDNLTSVTIGDSITSIGLDAFSNCPIETATIPTTAIEAIKNKSLKRVILTGGTNIGSNAFSHCDNLTSITIPNSVTSIGNDAFAYCFNLRSITYNGTKSEWNSISKGYYWNNGRNVPVTCTDGTFYIYN